MQLAEKLSEFSVKILGNVRGRDELETVLNKTGKESEERFELLARLELALKYEEIFVSLNFFLFTFINVYKLNFFGAWQQQQKKQFVAHSNCQQKLVEIWYTGIRNLTKMNNIAKAFIFIGFILAIPFGCLAYIVAPTSKVNLYSLSFI